MPFCTKCGRKLEEGEVCNCETKQVTQPEQQPVNASQKQNSGFFSNLFWQAKRSFTKPLSDTVTEDEKGSWANGLIFAGINALIAGLAAMALIKGLYASALGGLGYYISYGFPWAGAFFGGVLTSFIVYFALCGTVMLVSLLAKKKKSFLSIMARIGNISLLFAALGLIVCLFGLVSGLLGLMILLLSWILWTMLGYRLCADELQGKEWTKLGIMSLFAGQSVVAGIIGFEILMALII